MPEYNPIHTSLSLTHNILVNIAWMVKFIKQWILQSFIWIRQARQLWIILFELVIKFCPLQDLLRILILLQTNRIFSLLVKFHPFLPFLHLIFSSVLTDIHHQLRGTERKMTFFLRGNCWTFCTLFVVWSFLGEMKILVQFWKHQLRQHHHSYLV